MNFLLRNIWLKVVRQFTLYRVRDVSRFLNWYFSQSNLSKLVIQVGANDGEQSDPLRRFLRRRDKYSAILIEPIPFYVSKLKKLYENRGDIEIIEGACGGRREVKSLYFIDPIVADQMNGDGPHNNWAHGQGSFNYDTVVFWINENRFRGKSYIEKIPFYISSIQSVALNIKPICEIVAEHPNQLLVMDVQGFELEVLKGVDWQSNPPAHILLEDDLGKTSQITTFLFERGYRYVCGDVDKVFSRIL
jgi:FkbM family methyltransferase